MWRLVIFLSIFPPILAMVLRWWYGIRVLATRGPRVCRADLDKWLPEPEKTSVARRSDETAHVIGFHLWQYALRQWAKDDPKAAAARGKAKRIGTVLPPFTVLIVAFALVLGKLPLLGAFALVTGSIALAALFTCLTLPAELKEVARAANRLRKAGAFRLRDDEDAVVECAIAHAWNQSLPPVLRWMQGGG